MRGMRSLELLSVNSLLLLWLCSSLASSSKPALNSVLPSDGLSLMAFASKADLNHHLQFSPNSTLHFCQWQGVTCFQQRVVRLALQDLDLDGVFAPNTLTRLDQLRVLSLQNNSLAGPVPDLSRLLNLKTLFLDHNNFTGSFPPSILFLHRLRILDLSYNDFSGPLPARLTTLERLNYLRLEWNGFNGSVPALNQSSLRTFNVSGNNLTGAIPVTSTLLWFGPSSFSWNPGLCGEIIHKECRPGPPFFGPTTSDTVSPPPAVALGQSAEVRGFHQFTEPPQKRHKRTAVIIGFSSVVFFLIGSFVCFFVAVRKHRNQKESRAVMASDDAAAAQAAAVMQIEQDNELEEKVKRVQGIQMSKSGNLVFCAGEAHLYTLDQLMRGSAELLGRGTMGTTYKAVLDKRLIVSVKRLDATKMADTSKEEFERHMEAVGGLRHPNLVPLRAYFQAMEERLLVYDYQPNGSLFSLIHGILPRSLSPPPNTF